MNKHRLWGRHYRFYTYEEDHEESKSGESVQEVVVSRCPVSQNVSWRGIQKDTKKGIDKRYGKSFMALCLPKMLIFVFSLADPVRGRKVHEFVSSSR